VESLRRGHALGSKRKDWPSDRQGWLQSAEHWLHLSRKLPAVLAGEEEPANVVEHGQLASLCQQPYERRYAASARLWQDVFRKQPALAANPQDGIRYNAACAAALAGCGQGRDAATLDAKQKASWRRQAWEWLRADVAIWARNATRTDAGVRQVVRDQLQHWQEDSDLAGVRDSQALANLPAAERNDWCKLWAEVATILRQATAAADGALSARSAGNG
jgi:serine/threonine-protein kinase